MTKMSHLSTVDVDIDDNVYIFHKSVVYRVVVHEITIKKSGVMYGVHNGDASSWLPREKIFKNKAEIKASIDSRFDEIARNKNEL